MTVEKVLFNEFFCNPTILGLGCGQFHDSLLAKTAGIPGSLDLASLDCNH